MKMTRNELKSFIIKEIILSLIEEGKINEAKKIGNNNRELLEEGWLKSLLDKISKVPVAGGAKTGGRYPKIEDIEDEEQFEDLMANTAAELAKSGQYTKDQALATTKKFSKASPDLSPEEHRAIADIVSKLSVEDLKSIVDAEKKEDATIDKETGEEETGKEEAKTAAEVIRDLRKELISSEGFQSDEVEYLQTLASLIRAARDANISFDKKPRIKMLLKQVRDEVKDILSKAASEERYGFTLEEVVKRVKAILLEKKQNKK